MKTKPKLPSNILRVLVIVTMYLNYAFLTGKIIDFPRGTPKGGIIAASGVAVIIIIMFLVILVTRMIINKINNRAE